MSAEKSLDGRNHLSSAAAAIKLLLEQLCNEGGAQSKQF